MANDEHSIDEIQETIRRRLPTFVGLTTEAASELAHRIGADIRFVDPTKEEWFTSDQRHDRITANIINGRVVDARVE